MTKRLTLQKGTVLFLLVALILSACASREYEQAAADRSYAVEAVEAERVVSGAPSAANDGAADSFDSDVATNFAAGESSSQAQAQERLIIRTGNLTVVVEDAEASLRQITSLANSLGGWVVSSNAYQYTSSPTASLRGSLTVRVPAEQFDATMAQIKSMAVEVQSETTSGQDVTEEYVDLSSRLQNLEVTAARVRSFLADADDVEDALAVNAELSRLEGEIERTKGRMQYLSQSAAFSTISVDLIPDALSQPIEVGGWRPEGVVREALEALINTLQVLAEVIIWLGIYLLPVLLLLGIPAWLVFLAVRSWRRRRVATG